MMRAVLVLSALAAAAAQEVPIPSSPDGFRYNVTGNRSAPVQIEGYFDLMCPDTRVRTVDYAFCFSGRAVARRRGASLAILRLSRAVAHVATHC